MISQLIKRNSTSWMIVLTAILLVAVGVFLSQLIRTKAASQGYTEDKSLASFVPPPRTISDLVGQSDIIIQGSISKIVKEGYFSGYDNGGNLIPSQSPNQTNPSLPYTDYEVNVEKTLRDDGTVQSGKPLILRLIGHPQYAPNGNPSRQGYFPMSYPGDRHMFFLSKNPDNTYGLFYGPWSRLNVEGASVTISNDQRTPAKFGGQVLQPAEFLAQVKQAIQQIPVQPATPAQNPVEQRQLPQNAPLPQEVPTPDHP